MPRPQIGVARKFVLPKDLLVELRLLAALRGESMAETVRVALTEFVRRSKKSRRIA
jgi:hypothetical protein